MGIFRPLIADAGKRMFSPAALLTGGASLAVTGMKALKDAQKPAAVQAATQATSGTQAAKSPAMGASASPGGGGMAAPAGTLLTGPGGVDLTRLNLGRNTLLGQ